MQGYGWTTYDTRFGGSQTIHDSKLHIDLDTDFVKSGGSWAVRVTGTPRLDPNVKTTVIFHAAIEGATSDSARTLVCGKGSKDAKNAEAACHGSNPDLGSFEFLVLGDRRNKALHATAVKSVQVAEDKIWQAKCMIRH
jgi:mannosyl-oligosaccharide glucosidase